LPANDDVSLLDEAVRKAGEIALEYYRTSAKFWAKGDGSPVTEADMAVDKFLRETLMTARPDYGWLSEETADNTDRLGKQRVWIVDPIDGTSAFVKRTDQWCVATALIEDGRPVLTRIFRPLGDEMYAAERGKGARLNGRKLAVSRQSVLSESRVMARFGAFKPDYWRTPLPDIRVDAVTSLALRLCLVADGRFDATLTIGRKSNWDLAGGDLMVHEAGGRMTNLAGELFSYNEKTTQQGGGMLAANSEIHQQLLDFT
jgi:myo-inositol-1(or 4)-monophosphatase